MVLDINGGGHHPTYLRWILEAELSDPSDIVLACTPEQFQHPEILACAGRYVRQEIVMDRTMDLRLTDMTPLGLVRRNLLVSQLYRTAVAQQVRIGRVDLAIIPFVDDCAIGLALRREAFAGVPWLGVTMRTMFHHERMGVKNPSRKSLPVQRVTFRRLLAQVSLRAMLTIDETLAEFARQSGVKGSAKVRYLPDPANHHKDGIAKSEARAALGLPPEVDLIVIYGEISARKGLYTLLEAAADPSCARQLHVVVAGRCREAAALDKCAAYRQLLGEKRVHRIEGYLDSRQEGLLLAAVDCVWVAYENFYGMSGVMVLAGRHSLPIIASERGLIGYLTRRYGLGELVDTASKASVVGALNRLVMEPKWFTVAGAAAMSKFSEHTPTTFKRILTEIVEQTARG